MTASSGDTYREARMFKRFKSMMGNGKNTKSSKKFKSGKRAKGDDYDKEILDQIHEGSMLQIQEGQVAAGLKQSLDTVAELENLHPDTPLLAYGYYNAAVCCLRSGQESSAVDLLKKASVIKGDEKESQKDRLTYMMNLGDILTRMGKLPEAEKCLKEGLAEREYFYGESHPGVAFGLSPLAANLLAQGRAADAVPLIDRAVNINIQAGQPEVVDDLALRAFIVKSASGPQAPAFDGWESWPADLQQGVTEKVIQRGQEAEDETLAAVAGQVIKELVGRPLENVESTQRENLMVVGCNASRLAGDHKSRVEYGKHFLKQSQASGDPAQLVNAYEGLALAYDDLGEKNLAESTYKSAFKEAKRVENKLLMANVLRNLGLFYVDAKAKKKAFDTLKMANKAASQADDDTVLGRCLVALGVFVQHENQIELAQKLLERSIRKLPMAHADRFCAMSHLIAIEKKLPCACDGESGQQAIGTMLEEIVRMSLPSGLLKSIKVGEEVQVELAREPTAEEAENLNTMVQLAMHQMRVGFGLARFE